MHNHFFNITLHEPKSVFIFNFDLIRDIYENHSYDKSAFIKNGDITSYYCISI